jgi:DNA repair protein RadA/Sms
VRTASDLVRAKSTGVAVILIGHVVKDGQIAGPKAVEHLVDAVLISKRARLSFPHLARGKEPFRRDRRNRRFEMTGTGLAEVANPPRFSRRPLGPGVRRAAWPA